MALRVLAPVDGSDITWRAFERGLLLLKGTPGLTVTAFNVRQAGFEGASEDSVESFDKNERDEIFPTAAASERCLREAQEIGKRVGVQVQVKSAEGTHYEAILSEAEHHDVLLMHHLSSSSLKDALKGSRGEDLARNVKASVLFVRAD
ncbi:MAG TPA: universal stress protein [Candidatus Thermoplasmatota archaeon]|nr:universal stress protein [Candidatus Thermoplasmatota archaeon]